MLILADDLSGAADCGVAFVGAGLNTVVALKEPAGDVTADVLSLDADTRRMDPGAAALAVGRIVRNYSSSQDPLLYKKIDSTLRGNVAIELAAALDAHRSAQAHNARTIAVMAPAFPAIGRTTVNGIQLAHGQPLHGLDIWHHQGMTGRAHIPDMLASAGLKCTLLQLEAIRSPCSALSDRMKLSSTQADVLVCDAETDEDLLAIASASMGLERKPIWVGSAGLAYQLPHAAGIGSATGVEPIELPPHPGSLLFVIGSLSRNSIEQVRVLISSSDTLELSVPPEVLLAPMESARWHEYAHQLQNAIHANHDVVLSPAPEPRVDLVQRPLLAAALARLATSAGDGMGALVAAGGETARAVLQGWGVNCLRLLGELQRGIPVSITENWSRQLPVITKAGDFGDTDALLKCSQFMHSAELNVGPPQSIGRAIL
ncbi:MAG TPA: four-carbon acid sugar kinase family protein [Terracidiphilus sp.]|nr:four-carbon acid sugar kinase family protein [Terracidiphilus sp.]